MKHGRLIDADALEEKVEHDYHHKKINRYDRDLLLHYLDVEMAPAIEPEPKWIPCSERLPEESGRYLISVLDGVGRRTTVAPYQPRYKAWTMTGRMAYWKVIAWMPLPDSYRGAND